MLKQIQMILSVYIKMQTFLVIILSVLVFQSGLLAQQTGSISGRITDKSNNEELIGANVMVVGTTIGASSDLDGKFNIKGLQPGKYSIKVSYISYQSVTVENIDVLWIKGRFVVRAFEVEHTTSIYSGILRMADLMALQPNLNINAHIVAPLDRKEKVLGEISRPVFAFLEKGPLAENCSYISYDSVEELSKEKRLEYMTDLVLEEYSEYAAEADF